jgi:threonine dehydratase
LAENLKIIVEPGGAVAAAALLNKKIEIKNKTIVVMISGGNIDNELFSKIVSGL